MKLRRIMKAQSPKKKEKERYNNNNNNNKEKKKRISIRGHATRISGKARGYVVRRINIKALCMFRFPAKMPLKIQQNLVKELGQDTKRLPEGWDPWDV